MMEILDLRSGSPGQLSDIDAPKLEPNHPPPPTPKKNVGGGGQITSPYLGQK